METEKEILKTFGNENPFSVPEGYFENFAAQMQEKAKTLPAPKVRRVFFTPARMAMLFSSAAAVALAVFVAVSLFRVPSVAPSADLAQNDDSAVQDSEQTEWLAYLDNDTQVEAFVANFESETYGY